MALLDYAVKGMLSALMMFVIATPASAQGGPTQQSGPITPGHVASWVTNGVLQDGGSALDGNVKELGITAPGTPLCISDAPTSGPNHQLCFGANVTGGGLLSYQAYGGASPLPFKCVINGQTTSCGVGGSSGGTSGAVAAIGPSPPPSPAVGQLWWDSQGGNLFIWYNDGTSQQWVQTNSPTASSLGKKGKKAH